jgi:photosystem II stability/assembly factor-like uncharacterized protein
VRLLAVAVAAAALLLAGCTASTNGTGSARTASAPSSAPASTASPTASSPPSPAPSTSSALPPAPRSGPLNGLQVADLTFVGAEGWALGTVGCASGSGRCTAIAHSTDNGRTWHSIVAPRVNVSIAGLDDGPCAAPCVQHIRFATSRVGYLFGNTPQRTLYLTTDRGRTWRRQPGGADALESLDGNVIRIDDGGGCPPGCRYVAETAGIGGTGWLRAPLPGAVNETTGIALARTGAHAYLLAFGHPAGGAPDARSTLWTSADDGRHWIHRGEPCPQGGHEVDSVALTTAPDGSVTVLCRVRDASGGQFTATSTGGGGHFVAGSRAALGDAPVGAIAAAGRSAVFVSSDDTYRTTDGGRRFTRLAANGGDSPGALGWLGFASPTVAHAISVDRRTIWTTTDGGRRWTPGKIS